MSSKKILIIGAGLAGLAAYSRLTQDGYDVLILEARDYCGGRISTDATLGLPIGRGAGWIHGIENNPIAELAVRFHATMLPSDLNHFIKFDRNGISIPANEIQQFEMKFSELLKKAKTLAFQAKQDISLCSVLSDLVSSAHFSSAEEDLFQCKLRFFSGYLGADYTLLSARYWDQEEIWPGENCFLTNSYQPIIDGLSKDCRVQLNTVVNTIRMHQHDVELVTSKGNFSADAVIITLPLGVLKANTVTFDPPLPEDKQQAIQRLGMGLLNVFAFKFPALFWPARMHAMALPVTDASSILSFINLNHFVEQPILLGYCGGDQARQLEQIENAHIVEHTMHHLKKIFGTDIPDPESYFMTRWASDPFSCGSYSYFAVGASSGDYDALAEPVLNRLFFAGEATSASYLATTHGAYLSGIREAERIKHIFQF